MGEKGNALGGLLGQKASSPLDGPAARKAATPLTAGLPDAASPRPNSLPDPPRSAQKAPGEGALPHGSAASSPPSSTLTPIIAVGSDDDRDEPEL